MSGRSSYQIIKLGASKHWWRDIYYLVLRSRWWSFFLLIFTTYIVINLLFATLYYYSPDSLVDNAHESFMTCFLFSVQTMSTVGYGFLRPSSSLGHMLMVVECILGVIFVAMITGITFAKFSRPRAKMLFSKSLLKTVFGGEEVLMFRVGNIRANRVLGAKIGLTAVIKNHQSQMRRLYAVTPLRDHTPVFELSWTVIIPLAKNLELQESLRADNPDFTLVVNIAGHDTDFSSDLIDSYNYKVEDLVEGSRFVDIVVEDTPERRTLDYSKFHDIQV